MREHEVQAWIAHLMLRMLGSEAVKQFADRIREKLRASRRRVAYVVAQQRRDAARFRKELADQEELHEREIERLKSQILRISEERDHYVAIAQRELQRVLAETAILARKEVDAQNGI